MISKKVIAVKAGHTLYGVGVGAVGIRKESEINREYAPFVIKYLEIAGYTVIDCTIDNSSNNLVESVRKAINSGATLFISCHANSGVPSAHGCEAIYHEGNNDTKQLATTISNAISGNCGYYNRGAKSDVAIGRSDLYETSKSPINSIIIEALFVTNQGDIDKFDPDLIGHSIAEAIHGDVICLPEAKPTPIVEPIQVVQPSVPTEAELHEKEINDIVYLLHNLLGIDSNLWVKKMIDDINIYYLGKKILTYINGNINTNKYDGVLKAITGRFSIDTNLWSSKMATDENIYWLIKKASDYMSSKNI